MLHKHSSLITYAKTCLDKPFQYGAKPEDAPGKFDCSSLVQYLFKKIDVELPRSSLQQAHLGREVSSTQLKMGDLLFFHGKIGHYNLEFPQGIGHVALYLGDENVIEATGDTGKVILTPLKKILERDDLVVIKRVL
jgi:cell wall-associated NlpC family hydrolase